MHISVFSWMKIFTVSITWNLKILSLPVQGINFVKVNCFLWIRYSGSVDNRHYSLRMQIAQFAVPREFFFMSKCRRIYITSDLNSRVYWIGKINIEANKVYSQHLIDEAHPPSPLGVRNGCTQATEKLPSGGMISFVFPKSLAFLNALWIVRSLQREYRKRAIATLHTKAQHTHFKMNNTH